MQYIQTCRRMVAAVVFGVLLAPVASADPPADKGKATAVEKVPGKGKPAAHERDGDDTQGKAADARGQVVSDCNHRANEKNLEGKDRQEYVEWCIDRGGQHKYDDRRYDQDRSCYRLAEQKGMSGDARRTFIENCLRRQEKNR